MTSKQDDFPPFGELRADVERLRAALRSALEKATACAPADRLRELEPLWAILDATGLHDQSGSDQQ